MHGAQGVTISQQRPAECTALWLQFGHPEWGGGGCHKGKARVPVGMSGCAHWFEISGSLCLRHLSQATGGMYLWRVRVGEVSLCSQVLLLLLGVPRGGGGGVKGCMSRRPHVAHAQTQACTSRSCATLQPGFEASTDRKTGPVPLRRTGRTAGQVCRLVLPLV